MGNNGQTIPLGDASFYQTGCQPIASLFIVFVAETGILENNAITMRVKLRIAADKIVDGVVANSNDLVS